MTSINLISPKNSAHNYNVRFREPITIRKNSKVYLNFAHLVRLNSIHFDTPQTITLSDMSFNPRVIPADGQTETSLTTNQITIPIINPATGARGYTVQELEDTISTQFQALQAANPELNIYSVIERLDHNTDENQFLTGFFIDDDPVKLPEIAFEKNAAHERDAGDGADVNGIDCVYFKNSATAANPHYDSYALGTEKFFHFAAQCMGATSQMVSGTYLHAKTNIDMNAQQGNISFGLYSEEFATQPTAFTGWVEKTTGTGATTSGGALNNPAIFRGSTQLNAGTASANDLRNGLLASFLTIECTGINQTSPRNVSQLKILVPSRTTGNSRPIVWGSIDQDVKKMITLQTFPLRTVYPDLDAPFEIVLVFYIPTTDQNYLSNADRKVYFKLYRNTVDATAGTNEIFDSKTRHFYYTQSFFTGLGNLNVGTAAQIEAKVNSSIPFTPIVAAQAENEGFEIVQYRSFDKTAGGAATTAKPAAILETYKLNFTEQLSEVVGATQSRVLFPNVCEMDARFFYFEDIVAAWKNTSFDIMLNGLPIKNFKNKEDKSDGGFSKSLLASIPVPFLEGNTIEGMSASYSLLSGLYEPNIKNELKLRNQEMTINSLNVEINDTYTEKPSEELYRAHISLTITDEEEETN